MTSFWTWLFIAQAVVGWLAIAVAIGCIRLAKREHWTNRPEPRKVWFIRHQYTGVLYAFPFAEEPTEQQVREVMKALAEVHVRAGGKDPWWCRTIEMPLLEKNTRVPLGLLRAEPGPLGPPGEAVAAIQRMQVSATGTFRKKA